MKKLGLILSIMFWIVLMPMAKVEAAEIVDSGTCGTDLTWTMDDEGTLVISGEGIILEDYSTTKQSPFPAEIKKVVINAKLERIGAYAFYNRSNIESVIFNDGLLQIGNCAFEGCTGLTRINFPESINSIAYRAFVGCTGLVEILLSDNVNYFGGYSFMDCTGLKKIDIPFDAQIMGQGTFWGCTGLEEISITQGTQKIPNNTFTNCTGLKKIIIPNSVTTIGDSVFSGCTNLREISLPSSITKIGEEAFKWCNSIEKIVLPSELTELGKGAFRYCNGLVEIIIPKGVTKLENYTFEQCVNLTQVDIPYGVTSIGDGAFKLTKLESTNIPTSVISIGASAFEQCGLSKVTIPNSIRSIGDSAFESNPLKSVILPNGIEKLGNAVFMGCFLLEEIAIPNSVSEIGDGLLLNGAKNAVIKCSAGSYAEQYAKEYGYSYVLVSGNIGVTVSENTVNLSSAKTNNETSANENHLLAKAIYKETLPISLVAGQPMEIETNLVKQYKTITLNWVKNILNSIKITIECTVLGDASTVKEYILYQGDKKLASSTTGKITVKLDENCLGKNYYVEVVSTKGERTKTALQLNVVTGMMEKELELKLGGDSIELTLPDEIPFLGGTKLELDAGLFPVYAMQTSDGAVRVGINLKKDMLKDESKFFDFKNCWKGLTTDIYKGVKYLQKDLSMLKTVLNNPEHPWKFGPNKINLTIAGYGEGKLDENGTLLTTLDFMVSISGSHTAAKQLFFFEVPIVVTMELGIEGGFEEKLTIEWGDKGMSLKEGDIILDWSGKITFFGGVGIKFIAAVGVYGSGELSGEFVLLGTDKETGLERMDLTLEAGLKGYVGPLKGEIVLANKTWNIYSRQEVQTFSLRTVSGPMADEAENASLYNASTYQLSNEKYGAVFTAEEGDTGYIIEDAFISAQPVVASTDSYHIMAYLTMDPSRPAVDSTVLMYMIYDKTQGCWSEPKKVDTDATMDWTASLYSNGETVRLVYVQQDKLLSEGIGINDLTTGMKITSAIFDFEKMKFIDFQDVAKSNNEVYVSRPAITEKENVPIIYWVQGPTDDYFGTNSENSIYYSSLGDTGWSEAELLVKGRNCITELAAGYIGLDAGVAFVTDSDNNLDTDDDRIITIVSGEKELEVATGEVCNILFGVLPGQMNPSLLWFSDGNIAVLSATENETQYLFLENEEGVLSNSVESDFRIVGNKILFSKTDVSGNVGVYSISYENETYGNSIPIVSATGSISSFAATDNMAVWVDTETTMQEGLIEDYSAIGYCLYNEQYDLQALYADYTWEKLEPGKEISVTIGVQNNTDTEITTLYVTVLNTNEEVVFDTFTDCNIASGASDEIEVVITAPLDFGSTSYKVLVTGQQTDTIPDNNYTDLNFGLTELSMSARETIFEEKGYLVLEVVNESFVGVGGIVTVSDKDGNVLYTEVIENVEGRGTYSIVIEVAEFLLEEVEKTVVVTVEANKAEYSTLNNTAMENVVVLSGEIPYVSVSFMNGEEELSNTIYAVGADIEPDELPTDAFGWYELGDETQTLVTDFTNITTDKVYVAKGSTLEVTVCEDVSTDLVPLLMEQGITTEGMSYSCDSANAVVDTNGLVTAVTSGTATVTATSDNVAIKVIFTIVEHKYPENWTMTLEPTPENPGLYTKQCGNCGKVEEKEIAILKFSGASLSLSSDISVKYEVKEELFAEGEYSNPYVVFQFNDKEIRISEYTVKDGKYIFTFTDIAPKQINDTIYATLYAELDGQEYSSATREYSVATYCYNMLAKCVGNESYTSFCTLLVDMINYGAAAQTYFNYNTENLVTEGLTAELATLGTQNNPVLEDILVRDYVVKENATVTWKGAGLRLEEAVTIRFKIATESIDGLEMRIEGESGGNWSIPGSKFVVTDGGYFVFFDGLKASKMSEPVYATIYKDDVAVSNTIRYSIESYACSMQDSADEALRELLIAMMKYGNAANTYVNE